MTPRRMRFSDDIERLARRQRLFFPTAAAALAMVLIGACIGCSDLPFLPAAASRMEVKGITLADWTAGGYSTAAAAAAVDRIAMTGANTLPVVITAYQTDVAANEVRVDNQLTPTQASLTPIVLQVQSLSAPLELVLKPHVDVDTGAWRGGISPSDPARWFESYRAFLLPWAAQAEAWGAGQFVVGTELAGTLEHENRWRGLIADVREVYSGELVYAASWDEAREVPFWDAVDLVGVNFYAPVSGRKDSNRFEILRGWQPWLNRLQLLHKLTGRDVLLSEIGYRSVDGAGMHPYDFDSDAAVDLVEQSDLYWGALEAIGDIPWIRGVYWWNWLANGASDEEVKDYTPKAKPAENELISAWR
ncbi:MAG: hypothetical protein OEN01_09995 [Candidatus Krumholzibacteria bacterium]|nr:hypothetical protein [Candidatus Krumholzibacteria bacterium]